MSHRSTFLAGLAVVLILVAILAVLVGEVLIAGLCMLGTTFTIYLRETRT